MWLWIGNVLLNDAVANNDTVVESSETETTDPAEVIQPNQSTDSLQHQVSEVEALYWKGRFHIEGFSFKGAVPGELVFGPDDQLQFSLMRPSGLPIMSLTVLEHEVCALFDLDGVQYRGSHESFLTLTEGALPANAIHLIFKPNRTRTPDGWDWYSTPRIPIRALDVDTQTDDFLNAGYKGWRRKTSTVDWAESMYISEPMNGLFAPISTSVQQPYGMQPVMSMRQFRSNP